MEWVGQKDLYGCAVACIAMAAGKEYEEVKALLTGFDLTRKGLFEHNAKELLFELGFSTVQLYRPCNLFNPQVKRERWPMEPFAPGHLCQVETPQGGHMVFVRKDGTVLDPARPGVYSLADFPKVSSIIGVYPIR